MKRRTVLRAGAATGLTAVVGGCYSMIDSNPGDRQETPEEEVDGEEAYQFYFNDETGTLGEAGNQEIPENASEQQVITNNRTEDEWQQMQLNDVNYAEYAVFENNATFNEVEEGSVQEIEQKTIQLYQQRQDSDEFQDQHNAEIFTESVLDAVLETTDASTGPAQSNIVKTVADHIAHTNDQVSLQNYKLSEGLSMIGDAGRGFSHPIGLLQYEENGETHQIRRNRKKIQRSSLQTRRKRVCNTIRCKH